MTTPITVRIVQGMTGRIYSAPASVVRLTRTQAIVRQSGFQADTRFRLADGLLVGAGYPHLDDRIHRDDLPALRAAVAASK